MPTTDPVTAAQWFETSATVRMRDDLVVIDLQGEDQRSWLNGQITNDVRHTRSGDGVYALVLNVRGKILCDLWVVDRDGQLSLVVPRSTQQALVEHLEQYVIMEDVTLSVRADRTVISVQGPRCVQAAKAHEADSFVCDELGTGGRFVIVAADAAPHALDQMVASAANVGGGHADESAFELARLRRGIPRFGIDFDDSCYPQEAGLKARAVSFSKGCYLGQEVVCTLENRGKLSRRLLAFRFDGAAPQVGDSIVDDAGEESGKLTSVAIEDSGGRALGYARRIHIDRHALLSTGGGVRLSMQRAVGDT